MFNLTIFPSSLKEEWFHFISVYIDNPGHNTYIYSTVLHWAQSTPFVYSIYR